NPVQDFFEGFRMEFERKVPKQLLLPPEHNLLKSLCRSASSKNVQSISKLKRGITERTMAPTPPVDLSTLPVVVLDNGASTMKLGLATDSRPRVIPNCISKTKSERRRPFIGNQIDDCRDTSGLFFMLPFQKGYMVNPDLEKTIWDYAFGHECMNINPADCNILVTEPQLNFTHVQEAMCELLFEEYEFKGVCRTTAGHLVDYKFALENSKCVCTLVVDSGYSFTHIIPYVNGRKVANCVKRINIGGKALTNYLKEVISYRQIHVLDETYLMNQVKEDLCFVSTDFLNDIKIAKNKFPENTIVRDYALPDYTNIRRGYIKPLEETGKKSAENEQVLRMNNERFTIPELLFHPTDVNIIQQGIPEAIEHIVSSFPSAMQSHFYRNIVVVGGNTKFPGFKERLYNEVRSRAPTIFQVNLTVPDDPVTYAWKGGSQFAGDPDFKKYLVTKSMYNEAGIMAFAKISDI
ncbi:unnamed protein product, partial [Allacma fusca]